MSPAFQMQPVFLQMSHFYWDLEADHGPQAEGPWSCFAAVCFALVETVSHTFASDRLGAFARERQGRKGEKGPSFKSNVGFVRVRVCGRVDV